MNPLLLLVALNLLDQKKSLSVRNIKKHLLSPAYLDNFNIESLLDKLQNTVNTLDKVNRLSQIMHEPKALKAPSTDEAALPVAFDQVEQLAQLTKMMQGVDLKALMQNIGPIMNMIGNSQEK